MSFLAPVRSTVRSALSVAGLAARPAVRGAEELMRRLTAKRTHDAPAAPARAAPDPAAPAAPTAAAPVVPQWSAPTPAPPPAAPPRSTVGEDTVQREFEPRHMVVEPPEVVHSTADPGAADGAGATLRIDEPWSGYRDMRASDIVDRLVVADRATLAAVTLYEASHRRRSTVLHAAKDRLQRAAGRD